MNQDSSLYNSFGNDAYSHSLIVYFLLHLLVSGDIPICEDILQKDGQPPSPQSGAQRNIHLYYLFIEEKHYGLMVLPFLVRPHSYLSELKYPLSRSFSVFLFIYLLKYLSFYLSITLSPSLHVSHNNVCQSFFS